MFAGKWESVQAYLGSKKCPVIGDDVHGSLVTTIMGMKTLLPRMDYNTNMKQVRLYVVDDEIIGVKIETMCGALIQSFGVVSPILYS